MKTALLRWSSIFLLAARALGAEPLDPGSDWPQFLGPTRDGVSPETALLESWTAAGPPLLWDKSIGTGYCAPSVRGNNLILFHRVGDQEIVACLDARTGKEIWTHGYPSHFIDPYGYNNGPRGAPLITENRVYTFGAEGKLTCLDLATGAQVWQLDTATKWRIPEAFFGVGTSPVLEDGRLLVMVGGQPNSGLAALDPVTGKTLWENVGETNWQGIPMTGWPGQPPIQWDAFEKQASYSTPVIATVRGKKRTFCFTRQGLVSLDPATGAVDFSFGFRAQVPQSVNAMSPVVKDDMVFISSAYYRTGSALLQVGADIHSFSPVWRGTSLEIHWNTPVYHDGFLYAFSGRNEPDARFRCVDFKTGTVKWDLDERWRHTTPQPEVYGRGSAILADKRLIAAGEGGLLGMFKLNPEKPEEICRCQIPQLHYPCWSAPVLSRKRLYLRSEDHLLCFSLAPTPVAR